MRHGRARKRQAVWGARRWRWGRTSLIALLVGVVVGLAATVAVASHAGPRAARAAARDAGRYGPDLGRVEAAMQEAQWPQAQSNWCGVATVATIARYDGVAASQASAAATLNSPGATSLWGMPPHNASLPDPGFRANISRDLGTDPRSLAASLSIVLGAPYRQIVALGDMRDATTHLIADLLATKEPISVILDHGQHSAVVSGIYATGDPAGDPSSVYALEVWDPGAGSPYGQIQPGMMAVVPLDMWLSDPVYWGAPYDANYFPWLGEDFDPDPEVGPYAVQGQAHLWIGHYVYFKREAPWTPQALALPDWAFDANGALIAGIHGETPADYHGPVVPMPGTHPAAAPPVTASPATAPLASGAFATATPSVPAGTHLDLPWQPADFAKPWCFDAWCRPLAAVPLLAVGPASGGSAALLVTLVASGVHGVGVLGDRIRARRRRKRAGDQ